MFNSGTFYVDNGFRPCVSKSGHKWAYLLYLSSNRIKVKRVKTQKTGVPRPIVGMKPYSLSGLASAFLQRKNCFGSERKISKRAEKILREAIESDMRS